MKLKYIRRYFKGRGSFINPIVILFLAQLPIEICKVIVGPALLLDSGVEDRYLNYAIAVTSISFLVDYVLFRFSFAVSNRISFRSRWFNYSVKPSRMFLTACFFYFFFFLFFYLLTIHSFGFLNWLSSPRTGYQLHRTGAGQYWVFAISCLSVSFTLSIIFIKRFSLLFLAFLFYLFSSFFLGSKGIILEFFIFFLIVLWLREFKHINKIFIFGLPAALILMLLNFFWGSSLEAVELREIFSYFDHYLNSATYYRSYLNGEIPLFKGEILLTNYWSIVPRALYESKPYVYGISHVNEFFWPGAAEATNTPAFGGPVAYFADFGILGVIIFTFFDPIKFITYFFFCQLLKSYNYPAITSNMMMLSLFILFTSPFFLFLLAFPLNMIFFLLVVFFMLIINKLVFNNEISSR